MKKLLTWVTMICMMIVLPTFSLAEPVVQDQCPPQLVTRTGESGETIYAVIHDAQGNVVMNVEDGNAVVLVDIHERNAMEDNTSDIRLTSSFLSEMDDVHYSVNELLNSLGMDIDACFLVVYELFDICISEDVAAYLTEGCTMEIVLEAHPTIGTPATVLFISDGANWQIIPSVAEDDTYTVTVSGAGTIALLCDGQRYMGIGKTEKYSIEQITESVEAVSDNFTPSVSGKPSPELVTSVSNTHDTIVGYIRYNGNDEEIEVPDQNYVVITSVAERDYIVDILAHEHIEWAYNSILEVEDIGDLMSDNHEGTIAGDLDSVLQQMELDIFHDQLVVKDLFEVTAYGEYLHYLNDEDAYLELTFDPGIDSEKALLVIHSADGEHWHVHANEDVIRNADGTVTLRLYDLGAVAFLVEEEFEIDPEGAVQAP